MVTLAPVPSETATANVKVPAALAMPLMVPPGSTVRPGGSDPEATDHENGGIPPLADSVCVYEAPTVDCGSDEVVICRELARITTDNVFVVCTPALSVTWAVKLETPNLSGAPLMVPVVPSVRPDGSAPITTVHVYGGDPPVALSVCENAAPTAPGANDVVVMVRTGESMVSDRVAVVDTDELSITLTVNFDGPIAVAVPEIIPLGLRCRPSGREPLASDHVYGADPPVATSVWA
jgi:hypothetical protein